MLYCVITFISICWELTQKKLIAKIAYPLLTHNTNTNTNTNMMVTKICFFFIFIQFNTAFISECCLFFKDDGLYIIPITKLICKKNIFFSLFHSSNYPNHTLMLFGEKATKNIKCVRKIHEKLIHLYIRLPAIVNQIRLTDQIIY